MPEKFALVSVSDKNGVERIARALVDSGRKILSTGGTAEHLRERGIAVTDVSSLTQFPEIMDGRVKTLHPRIHGGILARRNNPKDVETMAKHDIPSIEFVIANLYPFSRVISRADTLESEALENIDIGGPCMVRAAAKNFPDVTVVVNPEDYDRVIEALGQGPIDIELRRELARRAFEHTSRYDAMIAEYLERDTRDDVDAPQRFGLSLERVMSLRYGENPHQKAAVYRTANELPLGGFVQLHGKELSYNNLVDLDAAFGLVREFSQPAAAVIKHTNPAGCAIGETVEDAFARALACDPMSAFGGIITLTEPCTKALAEKIVDSFFEIVAAPGFEPEATAVLTQKKNLRIMTMPTEPLAGRWTFRPSSLGWLVQEDDPFIALDRESIDVPTERAPTDQEWADLDFAWRVGKHVKSNGIVLARDGATIGLGAGQMSRVDAVQIAVRKCQSGTAGSVMSSDAFFPFRDGPDAAAEAGVTAIIQPGGSRRDDEVIAACNEHDIAMVFTGERHFRH